MANYFHTARVGALQPAAVIYETGPGHCQNCGAPYTTDTPPTIRSTDASPCLPAAPGVMATQVNFCLPPAAAFTRPGEGSYI